MVETGLSHQLPRDRRLKSRKSINALFQAGKKKKNWPLMLVWSIDEKSNSPTKFMVSVPKRQLKLAVDRNQVKRLIREVYRKNQHDLNRVCLESKININVSFIYLTKNEPNYQFIEKKVKELLDQLTITLNNKYLLC